MRFSKYTGSVMENDITSNDSFNEDRPTNSRALFDNEEYSPSNQQCELPSDSQNLYYLEQLSSINSRIDNLEHLNRENYLDLDSQKKTLKSLTYEISARESQINRGLSVLESSFYSLNYELYNHNLGNHDEFSYLNSQITELNNKNSHLRSMNEKLLAKLNALENKIEEVSCQQSKIEETILSQKKDEIASTESQNICSGVAQKTEIKSELAFVIPAVNPDINSNPIDKESFDSDINSLRKRIIRPLIFPLTSPIGDRERPSNTLSGPSGIIPISRSKKTNTGGCSIS